MPRQASSAPVAPDGLSLATGDNIGHVYLLRLENVTPGPPIITVWLAPGDSTPAFGCPHCGKAAKLNPFVIEADWPSIAAAWRGEAEG